MVFFLTDPDDFQVEQIGEITRLYGEFAEGEKVKVFPNEAFGFLRITVERPLRLRWEITETAILGTRAVDETRFQFRSSHSDQTGSGNAGATINVASSFTSWSKPSDRPARPPCCRRT